MPHSHTNPPTPLCEDSYPALVTLNCLPDPDTDPHSHPDTYQALVVSIHLALTHTPGLSQTRVPALSPRTATLNTALTPFTTVGVVAAKIERPQKQFDVEAINEEVRQSAGTEAAKG